MNDEKMNIESLSIDKLFSYNKLQHLYLWYQWYHDNNQKYDSDNEKYDSNNEMYDFNNEKYDLNTSPTQTHNAFNGKQLATNSIK